MIGFSQKYFFLDVFLLLMSVKRIDCWPEAYLTTKHCKVNGILHFDVCFNGNIYEYILQSQSTEY